MLGDEHETCSCGALHEQRHASPVCQPRKKTGGNVDAKLSCPLYYENRYALYITMRDRTHGDVQRRVIVPHIAEVWEWHHGLFLSCMMVHDLEFHRRVHHAGALVGPHSLCSRLPRRSTASLCRRD